jgi:deoxycytidylate deaminase
LPETRHGGYDACRSVHAEQNAIISAPRKDMINSELYLAGIRKDTGEYEKDSDSCQQCKKMIINAGIQRVIVRTQKDEYKIINVEDWVKNDDLLERKNYILNLGKEAKNAKANSCNSWKTKCAENQHSLIT